MKECQDTGENQLEIYKIETLGALDGPGLRTVIFLQGCPLRCGICHNSDSWYPGDGKVMTGDALYNLIMRYKPYYQKTGGVTFSGGEPLLQSAALIGLVKRLKASNIHIALDTSGCIYTEASLALIDLVDLVILDIKANTLEGTIALTRFDWESPLAVLAHLKATQKPYWIRQVVLKGINDTPSEHLWLDRMTASPHRQKLEYLPYHTLGEEKWNEKNKAYKATFECS